MAIGSGVYWFPSQRLNALAEAKTIGTMTSYLIDVFFTKETLSVSNLNGGGHCGYQQLNPNIVNAITGMLLCSLNYLIELKHQQIIILDKCK